MAILEVLVQTEYYGQRCLNRWNYRFTGTPAAVTPSFGLASAMGWVLAPAQVVFPDGTVADQIQKLVSDQVQFVQVQVRNVYSTTDFYLTPFPAGVIGTQTTTSGLSPATAFGLKSNRTRTDIRAGTKRFVGVTEGQIGGGGDLDPAAETDLTQLGDAMSQVITYDDEGNTLSYAPIIVSKEKYITPSGKEAYRYYATEAEQLMHVMDSIIWTPYTTTRTQVSRQYGRGG